MPVPLGVESPIPRSRDASRSAPRTVSPQRLPPPASPPLPPRSARVSASPAAARGPSRQNPPSARRSALSPPVAPSQQQQRGDSPAARRAESVENMQLRRQVDDLRQSLRDVQVVLTSHERELEGLWAQRRADDAGGVAAGTDITHLRREVANLRKELSQPRAETATQPDEPLGAGAAHLLFAQSREVMGGLDDRLRAQEERLAKESERVQGQLGSFREALQQGGWQQGQGLKGCEEKMSRAVDGVRSEFQSMIETTTALLRSPGVIVDPVGDPVTAARASQFRDALMRCVGTKLGTLCEGIRKEQEEQARVQREQLRALSSAQARDRSVLEALLEQKRVADLPAAGGGGDGGQQLALRVIGDQVQQQREELEDRLQQLQSESAHTDAAVAERLAQAGEMASRLDQMLAASAEDQDEAKRMVHDLRADFTAMCTDWQRSQENARGATVAVAEQCGSALQQHSRDVREQLQRAQADTKDQCHAAAEKALAASKAGEQLRALLEDNASQVKRLQAQVHELELERRDDLRRQQAAHADACTRVQQQCASDIHRLQKEVQAETQRQDDAASGLYRVVEELRAIQQRTLDEYHRQGDEQARAHARFQQQLAEASAALKDDAQQEAERLSALLRTENQGIADAVSRVRTDTQERMSAQERRTAELEQQGDSLRNRIRTLESIDMSSVAAATDDARRRMQELECRVHNFELWRQDCVSRIAGLDNKMQEAADARQLQALWRRVDGLEQGLSLARGAEREELRRALKQDVEEASSVLELKQERSVQKVQAVIQDQENVIKAVQRDLNQAESQVRQLAEQLRAMERSTDQQLRKVQESVTREMKPQLDAMAGRLAELHSDMQGIRDTASHTATETEHLNVRVGDLTEQLAGVSRRCEDVGREVGRVLDGRLVTIEPRVSALEDKVKAFGDQAAGLRKDLDANGDMDSKRSTEHGRALSELSEKLQGLLQDWDAIGKRMQEQEQENTQRSLELRQMADAAQKRHQFLTDECERLQKLIQESLENEKVREAQMNMIVQQVQESNRSCLETMQELHDEATQSVEEVQQDTRTWRDRVTGLETEVKQLQGYLEKVVKDSDEPVRKLSAQVMTLERRIETEMTKWRRDAVRLGLEKDEGEED